MEEGILSLKWNNHNSTFIHTLSTLHKVETYSDVTLACEGKYFQVHKLVLSICSEYFEEILLRTKCQHPIIVLKDIRHCDLEALLNYMYAGEANVSQSELATLIKAAECLRIKGLAVPDETPPLRDKRRLGETPDPTHSNKKIRSEEPYACNSNFSPIYKTNESNSENSRISSKSKRRSDDASQRSTTDSSNEDCVTQIDDETYRSITVPEIILEGQSVEVKQEMTEPKIEEHGEEESQHHIEDTNVGLSYAVNIGNDNKDEEAHTQDSHLLPDLMTHSAVPGPSGVQGHESLSSWESNANSMSGYSGENYSSEEARNQQLGALLVDGQSIYSGSKATDNRAMTFRTWQCPYQFCGYFADRESSLTKHIRKHTGEKPFTCSFCSFSSAQKSNLNSHIKLKHSEEFMKSFAHFKRNANFQDRMPYSSV